MFKRLKKQDVLAALNELYDPNDYQFAFFDQMRDLSKKNSTVFTETLLEALESDDDSLRARAALGLTVSHVKGLPTVQAALITHLKTDSDAMVREHCTVGLVEIHQKKPHPPQVLEAFIHASKDEDEKVAYACCWQLGYLAGPAAVAALFEALKHPGWGVRLQACKQLVLLKKVDAEVIDTLQALLANSIVQEHEARIDEARRTNQELSEKYPELAGNFKGESWGKASEILEKAREVAI